MGYIGGLLRFELIIRLCIVEFVWVGGGVEGLQYSSSFRTRALKVLRGGGATECGNYRCG